MNLKQKKQAKEIQDKVLTSLEEKMQAHAGKALPIEVDFSSIFSMEDQADINKAVSFFYMAVNPLEESIKQLCNDDMGKEAIAESFKGFKVKNIPNNTSSLAFDDGWLTLNVSLKSTGLMLKQRHEIVAFLEENL